MSIHYLDDAWPEEEKPVSKWQYNTGAFVVFIKEASEAFNINVRRTA